MDLYRRFYRDMDDYEKALSAYLVVIKIDPQDGEVWKEIGDIYLQTFCSKRRFITMKRRFVWNLARKFASVFGYVLL